MDLAQLANLGVPALILIGGGYLAGRFLSNEIKEWRLWYTGEYWPAHKEAADKQTETLIEVKSLLTQMVLNLNSAREGIEAIRNRE